MRSWAKSDLEAFGENPVLGRRVKWLFSPFPLRTEAVNNLQKVHGLE